MATGTRIHRERRRVRSGRRGEPPLSASLATRGVPCSRWGIFGSAEGMALLQDHRDVSLEIRASREVFVRAPQDVLDHSLGSLGDPPLERLTMTLDQRPSGGGIWCGEEIAQLSQAEAGLLAAQDERHTVEILPTVAAPTVRPRLSGPKSPTASQ